ncbi:hypothetical protein BH10ACI1_BH10ACI1_28530 [soil metagenome]
MKAKKIMRNENESVKASNEERENKHLRDLLQRAVNKEKVPESLREKIAKMIRE